MIRFEHLCFFLILPGLALAAPEPPPRRVLRLNLETARQYALRRNFQIEVSRIETKIADEGVVQQLGRFDPVFDISALRHETSRRTVFDKGVRLDQHSTDRIDELSSGIKGVSAWGTEYDLSYATNGTTAGRTLLRDQYDTVGRLGVTQPLLRDAGPTVNLAQVRIARRTARISEWQFRQEVIDVLTKLNFVYNELQLSIESLSVAERSRELARQLLKDNQSRVDIGVKSPLDVTEARSKVAEREESVILEQRNVLDNQNLLKQLVTSDQLEMLDVRVEIEPPVSPRFTVDVRRGIADALALRPDYRQALLKLEQQHIRVAVQKNALLPRIDLKGSLEFLGLDNSFGSSIARVGSRDATEWTAGVVFSIPLGNRAARGAYHQSQLEAARELVGIEQLEQKIIVDVDNASGQIVTARQRIVSTREARILARESLDAGEERLRAGTGTTFVVLEFQKQLAEAELAELRANSDYNKAVGDYQSFTGTTLREHNVVLK